MLQSIITGSGSYLPKKTVSNSEFEDIVFYDEDYTPIANKSTSEIIEKFVDITEITERRYVDNDGIMNSDLAAEAARFAIEDAGVNKEELDYVIVAHNFGDIDAAEKRVRLVPSLSALTKFKLGIKNSRCRPYDMIFGCPGWNEGMILADQLLKSGNAKKILVVGSETLSRTVDPFDRNSMIFSDGAGAVVVEARETNNRVGVLQHCTQSDNGIETFYLKMDVSLNPEYKVSNANISMNGRKIYEYALTYVPAAMKTIIDEEGLTITDIDKVLIHQANAKMDYAILQRLFKLYGLKSEDIPEGFAPMTIQKFGNSSVATIPTMYDMISKGNFENQSFKSGDRVIFASVGSGMNINAILYRIP
ncbi:MAG: ketoacyl-ACP synthase III [Flavobacteriaceae bacterium]|jgi:3-oxoacyl-[acyl-carrier-protein] synthase-3|nr:ketoacyl-ACP synthase III [Flavobacteriaceae bacterium]